MHLPLGIGINFRDTTRQSRPKTGTARLIRSLSIFALLACLGITGSSVMAETFTVRLGKTALGTLSYARSGNRHLLQSVLSNTPLGVFNGTFKGTSEKVPSPTGGTGQEFVGASKSSRKHRTVSTIISNGRAVKTTVTPQKEETELSDIALVPAGVTDPVRAIGQLINTQNGCPDTIKMYDGRRAIALRPKGAEKTETDLHCAFSYKVIAGPGHLSPLRISSAKMSLHYDISADRQRLTQIKLRSGIFSLYLDRTD